MRRTQPLGFAGRFLFVALMMALFAGCGGGSGSSTGAMGSGIRGTTTLRVVGGPANMSGSSITGVLGILSGAIVTVQPAGGGAELARVAADMQGGFQFDLTPGTYRLVPLLPAGVLATNGISPQFSFREVTVSRNVFTQVTVEYEEFAP